MRSQVTWTTSALERMLILRLQCRLITQGVAGSAAEKYAKENGFTFEAMKPDYIKGDSDSDGKVTISDVRTTLRYVCQKVELDEEQKLAADVEKDGVINIKDLRKVLRFVCNKIEEL